MVADQPDWVQPAVFVYAKLFDGIVSISGDIACDQYASVTVRVYNTNSTDHLSISYQFVDPVTGVIVDSGLLSCDNTQANAGWPSFTLPVTAGILRLFSFLDNTHATVIGTNNRAAKRLDSDFAPVRNFAGIIPTSSAANTRVQLLGTDTALAASIPQADLSNYNGQVMYYFSAAAVGITGNIEMGWLDAQQSRQRLVHLQNPSTTVQRVLGGHPYAFTSWWFNTTVVSPAQPVTVTLSIVPASPFQ